MARRLFFVSGIHSGHAELRGEEAKHLSRVLRVEPGQVYEISDNQQKYLARVSEAHKELVRFEVLEKLPFERESPEIHLYAAIIKFEHFEWGIEKATELGVDRIVPVQSARSENGLDKAVTKRLERWRRIALESSQQSRRVFLPELTPVMRFRDVVSQAEGQKVFLDEKRESGLLRELPKETSTISLLIGPEGGWTDDERSLAAGAGWISASLGPRVLRAETAWMASLAILRA
ncbi:MAG: RsmE family RNA methyltransferase [Acidobacteria bacterium]|nr:RsmE family RNA methyltransferase [Acidobacteriota bacterium]